MQNRRVVITGMGALTPLGLNAQSTWNNVAQGRSGIKRINNFDTTNFSVKIAGLIDRSHNNGLNIEKYIEARDIKKMDLFIQYGVIAAIEAVTDSGINIEDEALLKRTGVIMGSGIGGLGTIEKTSIELHNSNNGKVNPFFIPATLINLLAGHVSIRYGFKGPNHSVCTACATGAHSIGDAMRLIKFGDADIMIAGSAEATITPLGVAGFASVKALTTKFNDTPEIASRPWDKSHSGFVMSEGAGAIVLEEYEHAKKRGAKIYAEVLGYGLSGDAYHITSMHGRGAHQAMVNALKSAKLSVSQIDYINAHGTSTQVGDTIELETVQKLFVEQHPKIMMSSTKSSLGHLLGASGSVEIILSALTIQNNLILPTINLDTPIDDVKIDLVARESRSSKVKYIMSNSFGFGGTYASIIIGKV